MKDPRLLWQGTGSGLSNVEQAAALADAQALGAQLGSARPSLAALDDGGDKLRGDGEVWNTFEAAFAKAAGGAQRVEWVALLRKSFELEDENFDSLMRKSGLANQVAEKNDWWRSMFNIKPWAVWEEHRSEIHLKNGLLPRLLAQTHLDAWIAEVEAVRSAPWLDALCTASEIWLDRELLLEVVRRSPVAFLAKGGPTGSVLALLAAKWITDYARGIDEALTRRAQAQSGDTTALAAFREGELPTYLDEAFEALLLRDDGKHVAVHMSVRLARGVVSGPRAPVEVQEPGSFELDVLALTRLCEALRRHQLPLRAFGVAQGKRERAGARWSREKPVGNVVGGGSLREQVPAPDGEGAPSLVVDALPVWVASYFYAFTPSPREKDVETLWKWLSDILGKRDPGMSALEADGHGAARATQFLANVLARQQTPVACWCSTYDALEGQRRRELFFHLYPNDGYQAGLPSRVLLRVGLYAAGILGQDDSRDRQPEREDLFWAAEERGRRMWLLNGGKREWQLAYTSFFAFMPEILGQSLAQGLAMMWPRVATNPWMVCASASNLHNNSVPATTLLVVAESAGIDLLGVFAEQRRWTRKETKWAQFPDGFEECDRALRAAHSTTSA